MTCDRSVVFSGYSGFRHDITEILLKVALNTIPPPPSSFKKKQHFTSLHLCYTLKFRLNTCYKQLLTNCQKRMLWVRLLPRARCTTLCDKGRWFSRGPPVSRYNWNIVECNVKHNKTIKGECVLYRFVLYTTIYDIVKLIWWTPTIGLNLTPK